MSVDFEAIRKQEWPVLEQMVFLDAACVSFCPPAHGAGGEGLLPT